MTKRTAILIASPTANTDKVQSTKELRGSFYDIDNWSTFLQRPIGGCWNRNEIHDLSNSGSQRLFEVINQLNETDYVFFAYSGHGYNDGTDDYIFMDNGTKKVKVSDIIKEIYEANQSIKGTLIFDSCRIHLLNEKFVSLRGPLLPLNEGYLDELEKNARKDWDDAFSNSKTKGLVVIQTCKSGEESYMQPSGKVSVFSYHMANEGFETMEPLNVGSAFKNAKDLTIAEVDGWHDPDKKQHPQCNLNYRLVDYPFSLGKHESCLNAAAALVTQ